jgi:hypothetical protein
MLDIHIKVIPHSKQNYSTIGDYTVDVDKKKIEIRISDMGNWRYEALVAVHELVELSIAVLHKGILDKDIIEFDKRFEHECELNLHPIDAEPGDDIRAPYRDEHRFATIVEHMLANELKVNWGDYEQTIINLNEYPSCGA